MNLRYIKMAKGLDFLIDEKLTDVGLIMEISLNGMRMLGFDKRNSGNFSINTCKTLYFYEI